MLKSHPLTRPLPLEGERRMGFVDGHQLIRSAPQLPAGRSNAGAF